MENLSNVDDPNAKPHPKPTDDPGAQIETVTPDSQKEDLTNNQSVPKENTKDEFVEDVEDKGSSKEQESTPKDTNGEKDDDDLGIETVTPS